MSNAIDTRPARFDLGYLLILALIAIVTGWLVSMPFCRFIQRTTLDRFHLQTKPFVVWVAQQPIPAMYNFYNRYEITPSPWKGPNAQRSVKGTINHFPIRMFTFGDNRAIFLPNGELRAIDTWSRYRGEELHTRWLATPAAEGGFDLTCEVVQ